MPFWAEGEESVRLRPDRAKRARRTRLSERPIGAGKRAMDADNFLPHSLEKISAELSPMATSYNQARAMSLLWFGDLMEAARG